MKSLNLITMLAVLAFSGTAFAQFADSAATSSDDDRVASASDDWTVAEDMLEELDTIDGRWKVTVKPTGFDTCRRGKPKLTSYEWNVSTDDEKVEIEVVGENAFSKLHGRIRDDKMFLTGASDVLPKGDTVRPSVVHKLRKRSENKFTGEHHLLGVTDKGTACMTSYLVKVEKK